MSNSERSTVGRSIVYVVFGGAVLYLALTMAVSLVVNLYGTPPSTDLADAGAEPRAQWCQRALVELRDELLSQVANELQEPWDKGDPSARWRAWDERWQRDYNEAAERCRGTSLPSLVQGFTRLGELHLGCRDLVAQAIALRAQVTAAANDHT